MIAVIDTNILVSALWKPVSNASLLISNVISGNIKPCYDYRIIEEYRDVLNRPKFHFSGIQVEYLLDVFIQDGISVIPKPIPDARIIDEDDRAFYEVAKFCNAPLVTGNIRHFPEDACIMNLKTFCDRFL